MRNIITVLRVIIILLIVPKGLRAQIISTVVGTGISGYNGDGILATSAQLNRPTGIYVDSLGVIYISDYFNHRLRTVDVGGMISTTGGSGASGAYSGEGGAATSAVFPILGGVHKDGDRLLLCISGPTAERVCEIGATGIISTLAGSGALGYSGDGGPATAALLRPNDVMTHRSGRMYIADAGGRVRMVDADGVISTVAGSVSTGFGGDGGAATAAALSSPSGIFLDRPGNMYIADYGNSRIRKVDLSGTITTIAGSATAGYSGDYGPATAAQLNYATGIEGDGLGNMFVADRNNHVIRKIDVSGIITTIAGNGTNGYSGDGGMATSAQLNQPAYLSIHPNGDIYFTETFNHVVRKISYGNHIPVFTGGHVQSLSLCAGGSVALNTALAITDADAGQTLTWTVITPPAHGVAAAAYTTTATGGAVTPVGLAYTPASGYSGTDTFEVRADDGRSVAIVTFYVTVIPAPVAAIAGTDTLCVGDTATLAGTMAGGTWSAGGSAATVSATGLCTAVVPGMATISYTFSNSCGTATATHNIAVLPAGACAAGIAGVAGNEVTLFPNPAQDAIIVKLPHGKSGRLMVNDITGRVVQQQYVQHEATIHIAQSGVYIVTVTTDAGVWRGKVTITK